MSKEMGLSLDDLRKLQKAGGIMGSRPNTPVLADDVPRDLIEAWNSYLVSKEAYNEILAKYGIELL